MLPSVWVVHRKKSVSGAAGDRGWTDLGNVLGLSPPADGRRSYLEVIYPASDVFIGINIIPETQDFGDHSGGGCLCPSSAAHFRCLP